MSATDGQIGGQGNPLKILIIGSGEIEVFATIDNLKREYPALGTVDFHPFYYLCGDCEVPIEDGVCPQCGLEIEYRV